MQQCENVTMRKSENVTMRKCNYEKMRRDDKVTLSSICVFAFLYFEREKAKIRQMECEYTTDFICRIFALLLSCRISALLPRRYEKAETQRDVPSCFRIFTFCGEEAKIRQGVNQPPYNIIQNISLYTRLTVYSALLLLFKDKKKTKNKQKQTNKQ
jgi:hypothetical protein